MTVHIITPCLAVLEAADGELREENLLCVVNALLAENGLTSWPCAEAEAIALDDNVLVVAQPVRLFIPTVLQRLLER